MISPWIHPRIGPFPWQHVNRFQARGHVIGEVAYVVPDHSPEGTTSKGAVANGGDVYPAHVPVISP